MEPQPQSPLLALPAELRNTIYAFVLGDNIRDLSAEGHSMPSNSGLPMTCKQLYSEMIEMYYHYTSLRICTIDVHPDNEEELAKTEPHPLSGTLVPKCYAHVVPRLIFSHGYRRDPRMNRDYGLSVEDVDAYFRDIVLERARGSGVEFKEVVVERWFY